MNKILIVGGYGNVGKTISIRLADLFPGNVIIAGRRYEEAKKLSDHTLGKAVPRRINLDRLDAIDPILQDVGMVVMCIDQVDTALIKACFQRDIHYIDITANYALFSQVASLATHFQDYKATAILSVGLAPGLTNLLVKKCAQKLLSIDEAHIYLMLGLGDVHGEAAIRWIVREFGQSFTLPGPRANSVTQSFATSTQFTFSGDHRPRTVYAFNFPEQHTLPSTIGIPVRNWLCFDSRVVTRGLGFVSKIGSRDVWKRPAMQDRIVQLMKWISVGSDHFVVAVEAVGRDTHGEATYSYQIDGHDEAHITGIVASEVAKQLYIAKHSFGIFHIEQLFDFASFRDVLIEVGVVMPSSSLECSNVSCSAQPHRR